MSRTKLVISTFSLICVLSLGAILAPRLGAQEATPSGIVPHELAPGVTADVLGGVPSDRAPDQTVYTARFEFTRAARSFLTAILAPRRSPSLKGRSAGR